MKDLSKVLFITDMDGTLLPSNKRLNEKDISAIEKFRGMGGHFSVATGRSLQSARQYFGGLKICEPVILCNGGGIYDCAEKKYKWQNFVDISAYDVVRRVLDAFPEVGCEVNLSEDILVPRLTEQEDYHLKISYDGKYTPADINELPCGGWCKVLFAAPEEIIPDIAEFIAKIGNDTVEYVRSSRIFYEILPKNCTKGSALNVLRDIYGLDGWTVAACGDFDNDLEMIKNADMGVAPANAADCVKAAAHYVSAADCNNGAVAEALEYVINTL